MQLTFFDDPLISSPEVLNPKVARSGTFMDNMSLPVHRWFRYSAGFAAEWVGQVLDDWQIEAGQVVLDPFAGSGTVPVVCDHRGIKSVGVEAHPMVARICKAKLAWNASIDRFARFAGELVKRSRDVQCIFEAHPLLIQRSFDADALAALDALKMAWLALDDQSPESELAWLAITAILRPTASAGTAQWQYILPNKTKSKVISPQLALQQQLEMMKADMRWMQARAACSMADVINGDARSLNDFVPCIFHMRRSWRHLQRKASISVSMRARRTSYFALPQIALKASLRVFWMASRNG